MDFWRDGLEVAYIRFGDAAMFHDSEGFEEAKAIEHQINTGVFWCLKWAFEYAPRTDGEDPVVEQVVDSVINIGTPYQILVDALKFATGGGIELDVDTKERTLTVYEGICAAASEVSHKSLYL